MMFVAGGAAVVAVALLNSGVAGAVLAVVLLTSGLWRAVGLVRTWSREGSDPER
jgi:hypothetical protein